MLILGQRSPEWAEQKLGNSPFKIGRYGCTLVCLSMLTDYFSQFKGTWKSPDQLASKLSFTKDGLIIWSSLPAHTQFRLEKRLYSRNDVSIKESLKDPKRAVALQVENYHWVLALGKSPLGGYKIADPWSGDKTTTRKYKAITGSAHFIFN